MRATGPVHEDAHRAVHDHLAWIGRGPADLTATALRVFAAAAPDERLVLATADGAPGEVAEHHAADLASGRLMVIPALETYAPVLDGGDGVGAAQLAVYDAFVDDALAAGWSGIRVVADNTPMLAGTDEQAANWLAWEQVADHWELRRPVQGNCWFDASALDPARLGAALSRHPATVGGETAWRLSFEQDDDGALRLALAGALDAFDAPQLRQALETSLQLAGSDAGTLEVTLRDVTFLHHNAAVALADAGALPPGLRITAASDTVRRLLDVMPAPPGLDVA